MDDQLLKSVELELLDLRRRGESPSWDEYASRYPQDLESLRDLFDRLFHETFHETFHENTDTGPAPVSAAELDTVSLVAGPAIPSTLDLDATYDETPMLPTATRRLPRPFGPYELLDELARGGMGVVFRARQSKLNRLVALKMILSGELAGEEQVRRFYAEAESAAALDHPGIVPVFEVGEHEGQHFFSMGLVEGASLAVTIREQTLTPHQSVRLLQQVTDAVAYAHDQGVIHRDLKPANVLIDLSGQPRVTDFGLAKRVSGDSGMTASGQIMGTPSYMPPEQAAGRIEEINVTADVYSLCAILYEMLVGRPPFRGATPVETLRQVLESDPVEPSRLNPSVDRDLETICLKCLAKDPRERYPTAAALSQEMQRYLDGSPIEARRIGMAARSLRWCRRRPLQTGLIAASLMMVGLLGAFIMASRRAERVTQVSHLKSALNSQLRNADASPESIAGLETLVGTLRILDPVEAEAAEQKLTQEVGLIIQDQLRTQEISDDGKQFRDAIAWVRRRQPEVADQLDESLQKRMSDWRSLIELQSPLAEDQVKQLTGMTSLDVTNETISRTTAPSDRVILDGDCPTTAEIEVTFAEGWRSAPAIGLLLNASDDRGYEFVLRVNDGSNTAPETRAETSTGDNAILQIRKSNRVLQQVTVPIGKLPSGPISLRARRDRTQLSFQVESLPPIEIRDVFAISNEGSGNSDGNGRFGLVWPQQTKLTALHTRVRDLPSEPRLIEKADDLFYKRQIEDALEAYQRLARESASTDLQMEAKFKASICFIELKRFSEATTLLDQVQSSRVDPWSLLANCQRWLMHVRKGELAEADTIYDQLASQYSFEQLAASVPSEQRDEILAAFFSQSFTAESQSGLARIERAMRLDRFLSVDGRGDVERQIACIRAIEKAGRLNQTERVLKDLAKDFPVHVYPCYRLSMLARTNGDFYGSLKYIEQGMKTIDDSGFDINVSNLKLERIRTTAAMKNLDQALVYLDELDLEMQNSVISRDETVHGRKVHWSTLSHLALLRGFIYDERGRADDAVEVWSNGYRDTRQAIGSVDAAGSWLVLNVLILGSLSGDLAREDIPGLVVAMSGSAMPQQLVRMGLGQVGDDVVFQTLLRMWQRPGAKEIAKDGYALHKLSYHDRLTIPIHLAGREFVQQTAFADELVGGQQETIDQAIAEVLSLMESKKMGMMDLIGFGIGWKLPGESGQPFEALVDRLPDRAKALAAYIIGHRLAKTGGNLVDVRRWLELADVGLKNDQVAHSQIADELAELNANQGKLTIVNPLERDIEIEWTPESGETEIRSLGSKTTWQLVSGVYDVRVVDDQGAKMSSDKISVRPLVPETLIVESAWAPGPAETAWPGPIIRPAKLDGLRNWQIFHRHPFTDLKLMSGSPDGQFLALGGRDGLVRIYRTSDQQLVHLLPGHAENLTCLSWSADSRYLLTAAYEHLVQLWQFPDAKLLTSFTPPGGFNTATLSPDGQQIALGGWTGWINLLNREGTILNQGEVHAGLIPNVKWTADKNSIASCDALGHFKVTDMRDLSVEFERTFDSRVVFQFSPDLSQMAIAQINKGTIEIFDAKTWKLIRTLDTSMANIESLVWIEHKNQLAALSAYGELQVFDPENSIGAPVHQTKGEPANALATFGTEQLAVLSYQDEVTVWDSSLSQSVEMIDGKKRKVTTMAWHPQKDLVAIGFADGRLRFLNSLGQEKASAIKGSSPTSVAWTEDGKNLAVGFWNGELKVFDEDLAIMKTLSSQVGGREVAWTRQGKLLGGNGNSELREYDDLDQPPRVITNIKGHFTTPVVVTPELLIFTSENHLFHCVTLGEPSNTFSSDRKNFIHSVASSDELGRVAVSVGGSVEIYDSTQLTSDELNPIDTWNLGSGHIRGLAWAADDQSLFAIVNDGNLLRLNLDGQVIGTLRTKWQLCPEFFSLSPDDAVAVTGTNSPFVTFHDLNLNQPRLSVVLLDEDRTLKFFPGGYCVERLTDFDDELTCVTMDENGVVQMQPPSAFFQR